MTDPAAVVRTHLGAFSDGDLPGMLVTLAPDAVFTTGTTTVPPAEFEEFFGWAMREIDPMMTITTVVADGRRVACQFVEEVTSNGERRRLDRAAFFTVDNGLITSARVYDALD